MGAEFRPEAAPSARVAQSILVITVQHRSSGVLSNAQLRTAGPLEFDPRTAAALLRDIANQLAPVIVPSHDLSGDRRAC